MANQYHKSDFPLALTFNLKRQTPSGEQPVTTQYPFCLRFYVQGKGTPETGYLAEFDGRSTTNCKVLSPTQVMVFFDRTQMALPTGTLLLEAEFIIPDTNYEGDDEMNFKRLYRTGIELTDNPDDQTEGELTLEIMNAFVSNELILAAEEKAAAVATAKAIEVATPIARQVAEEATRDFIFATDSDIDALWA